MNAKLFEKCCKVAGVPVTKRQASKFRNGHGAASRMLNYIGEKGVNGWAENINSDAFNAEELKELRLRASMN